MLKAAYKLYNNNNEKGFKGKFNWIFFYCNKKFLCNKASY